MNSYSWEIKTAGPKTATINGIVLYEVIGAIEYNLIATNGNQTVKALPFANSVRLAWPSPENFKPKGTVTAEQKVSWLEAALGEEAIASLKATCDQKLSDSNVIVSFEGFADAEQIVPA